MCAYSEFNSCVIKIVMEFLFTSVVLVIMCGLENCDVDRLLELGKKCWG